MVRKTLEGPATEFASAMDNTIQTAMNAGPDAAFGAAAPEQPFPGTPIATTPIATTPVTTPPVTTMTEATRAGVVAGLPVVNAGMEASMDKVMKTAEEMMSFGQGNVEALVKSGQIWAAGMQDLTKSIAATAQTRLDAAMATMKAMSGVKSIKDAVDLQTTLARSSMEAVMAETGKITDASMKLAEQALAPITARVSLASDKFSRAA